MDAPAMSATLWLLAGLAGGVAHFALLRWNTLLYLNRAETGPLMHHRHGRAWPGHPHLEMSAALTHAIGLQVLRLSAIASLLAIAAWHGALPLLLAGLGVVLARPLVLRATQVTS
jgi:hypothetical protein